MLHLTRFPTEAIRIGDEVRLVVLEVQGRSVRIGIDAPTKISVDREEIWLRKRQETADTTDRD
jgi:carbon storage regulator